jgi:hypothetical protein
MQLPHRETTRDLQTSSTVPRSNYATARPLLDVVSGENRREHVVGRFAVHQGAASAIGAKCYLRKELEGH